MKRIAYLACVTLLMSILVVCSSLYAMEITVDIFAPDDLSSLKGGISQSATARCIARGVDLDAYSKLNITISQLGDMLLFDAILDTDPPRAFHKDLEDKAGISVAIDEMIGAIFIDTPIKKEPVSTKPPRRPDVKQQHAEINLPFVATSLATLAGEIYVSDLNTVYKIKDTKPTSWWSSPGRDEIFRLYPYQDTLIVIVKRLETFKGHTERLFTVAISPDDKIMASGGFDRTIRIWDLATAKHLRTLTGHTDWVRALAFTSDGRTLLSASRDLTIGVWDVMTGKRRQSLTGHTKSIQSLALIADKTIVTASGDWSIKVWDLVP